MILNTTRYILNWDPLQKTFETSKKEVELAILHVEKQIANSEKATVDIRELKTNIAESLGSVKKIVVQHLYFFYLNINLLNTRLKEFLTSDNFGVRKQWNNRESGGS